MHQLAAQSLAAIVSPSRWDPQCRQGHEGIRSSSPTTSLIAAVVHSAHQEIKSRCRRRRRRRRYHRRLTLRGLPSYRRKREIAAEVQGATRKQPAFQQARESRGAAVVLFPFFARFPPHPTPRARASDATSCQLADRLPVLQILPRFTRGLHRGRPVRPRRKNCADCTRENHRFDRPRRHVNASDRSRPPGASSSCFPRPAAAAVSWLPRWLFAAPLPTPFLPPRRGQNGIDGEGCLAVLPLPVVVAAAALDFLFDGRRRRIF